MSTPIHFLEFRREGESHGGLAGIDDDGRVYAPSGLLDNHEYAVYLAVRKGVPMAVCDEEVYLPTDWMAAHQPSLADACSLIEQYVRKGKSEVDQNDDRTSSTAD